MKNLKINHTLSVCVAALWLAGCSVSQADIGTSSWIPPEQRSVTRNAHPDRSGAPEVLRGRPKHVQDHCSSTGSGFQGEVGAKGSAEGKYPGAFKADGGWSSGGTRAGWFFNGSFTIKTSSTTISGTVQGSGSNAEPDIDCGFSTDKLTYVAGSKTGRASISFAREPDHHFVEKLYGL